MVGFRAELQALGIESHPEYEQIGDWYTESGERATQALLALPEPPTAVFAAADLMAVGAMKAARDAGLDVPGDLAVVGFDDIQLASLLPLFMMRDRDFYSLDAWRQSRSESPNKTSSN